MPSSRELQRRAREFAAQLNELLNGTVVDGPVLTAVARPTGDRAWIGYGISKQDVVASQAMPLSISAAPARAFLHVYHVLTLEADTGFLTADRDCPHPRRRRAGASQLDVRGYFAPDRLPTALGGIGDFHYGLAGDDLPPGEAGIHVSTREVTNDEMRQLLRHTAEGPSGLPVAVRDQLKRRLEEGDDPGAIAEWLMTVRREPGQDDVG